MTNDKRRSDKHKRKSYYRKCALASKRHRPDSMMNDRSVPKQLHPGLTGYIVTCNNQERSALIETYRLLNSVLALHNKTEKVPDSEDQEKQDNGQMTESSINMDAVEVHHDDDGDANGESDDEDIYSQLLKENNMGPSSQPESCTNSAQTLPFSFYSVKTGVSNCLFILHTPTHVHPSQLVHDIFQRLLSSKLPESRHVMRLIPVAATCHASTCALGPCVKSIWSKFVRVNITTTTNPNNPTDAPEQCNQETPALTHEQQEPSQNSEQPDKTIEPSPANPTQLSVTPQLPFGDILHGSKTFCVQFKARNYDRLPRDDAINAVVGAINSLTPEWRVCYSSPAVVISINIFRNVACISLLENFDLYRKYNIAELIHPTEQSKPDSNCPEPDNGVENDD